MSITTIKKKIMPIEIETDLLAFVCVRFTHQESKHGHSKASLLAWDVMGCAPFDVWRPPKRTWFVVGHTMVCGQSSLVHPLR